MPKHRFVTEKIESPTAVYVGIMRYNGLPIDIELMREKRKEAMHKIGQFKYEIGMIIGNDVQIGANASTSSFKKYLFERMELPKMKLTSKEQDALDDEAIILLKEWCAANEPQWVQLFDFVQGYRKWGKLKSIY
jgi:DNA polymerase-1